MRLGSPPLSPTRLSHYVQPKRGSHIIRMLSVTLAVAICYIVFSSTNAPVEWRLPTHHQGFGLKNESLPLNRTFASSSTISSISETHVAAQLTSMPTSSRSSSLAESQKSAVAHSQALKDAIAKAQAEESERARKQTEDEAASKKQVEEEQSKKQAQKGQSKLDRPTYYNIHDGRPFGIEQGMQEILALVPDEIYTRDLLKPIVGGGETRLREVGLRARLFKKYFAAWEALHVVSDGSAGGALVRDDIVKYLRDAPDLSGISDMPRAEIIRTYEQYRAFLSRFATILFPWTAPYFSDHITLHAHSFNAGRGLVMTGADNVWPYMATAIRSFREMGCELPVEVFYLGDNDLGDESREMLEAIPGVTTRNLKQMVADKGWELEGFASKAFSILMSSFREVLFLDADALFFRSPEVLFDDPAYVNTGALFFKDRLVTPQYKKKFLRQILPKPVSQKARTSYYWTGESSEMQESGAMVIDKWRHFISLLVITRLNGPDRSDNGDDKGVYSFFYGDKETFWLGFELAGDTDYNFHQGDGGALGGIKEVTRYMSEEDIKKKEEEEGKSSTEAGENAFEPAIIQNEVSENDVAKALAGEKDSKAGDAAVAPADHIENKHAPLVGGSKAADEKDGNNDDATTHDHSSPAVDDIAGQQQANEGLLSINDYGNPYGDAERYNAQQDHEQKDDSSSSDNKQHEELQESTEHETMRTMAEELRYIAAESNSKDSSERVETNQEADTDINTINRRHLSPQDSSSSPRPTETVSAENYTMEDFNSMDSSTNFTMCSPQLLHLDLEGRPLWFNGWIQEDKFDHNAKVPVSKFEYFLSERREIASSSSSLSSEGVLAADEEGVSRNSPVGPAAHWVLGNHNLCCLTSDRVHLLNKEELDVLHMIERIARQIGALE